MDGVGKPTNLTDLSVVRDLPTATVETGQPPKSTDAAELERLERQALIDGLNEDHVVHDTNPASGNTSTGTVDNAATPVAPPPVSASPDTNTGANSFGNNFAQALEDALREFPADEIVVSTHPPGRSHWLELGVVENARMRFDVPVTHVVVDLMGTTAAGFTGGAPQRLLDTRVANLPPNWP